ncbi:hypothetical protein [Enterovibrio nigricans]|uniref:Protein FliT n=1 Tax=Enterovibrio nigricans DSM 22720 TaxID=1121868 RepID=A0A1T4UK42_9GAMM|nr:hypothetical protein [Enterovibrio nigricans]PKF51188.1 hypothetical protein AT251_05720 [Enterovibrio nigricans]SKA53044.1 hypothetical protein SAMN02745132_01907 [Enterovibrio nigricans DSM 22720]
MVKTHSPASHQIQTLSKQIYQAVATQDWQTLQQLDLQVRALLTTHPDYLSMPSLSQELAQLKRVHQNAFTKLKHSVTEMESELEGMQAKQERAKAYQMAMTMEYTW